MAGVMRRAQKLGAGHVQHGDQVLEACEILCVVLDVPLHDCEIKALLHLVQLRQQVVAEMAAGLRV